MHSMRVNEPPKVRPSSLTAFALWAQRRPWPIPAFAKRVARSLLFRVRGNEPRLEGWSRPLIVGRAGPHAEMPGSEKDQPASAHLKCRATIKSGRSNARLRCLILTSVLDFGGVDEFAAFLARRVPSREIETIVMLADPSARRGHLFTALREEGIQVIDELPNDSCRWLATNRPDVISAHAPPDWILEAARALNIPVVETLHGAPTPIGTDWRKERSRSHNVSFFIAVSEMVRRQYLRGNPEFDEKLIVTVPNGYNDTHRSTVDRTMARAWLGLEDEFLFISLARHAQQKNGYGLIAAFAEVAGAFPQAHLVIAGRMHDREYTQQMLSLRGRLQAQQRIDLRDNLPDPSALFAAADGFVMNSFFEAGHLLRWRRSARGCRW